MASMRHVPTLRGSFVTLTLMVVGFLSSPTLGQLCGNGVVDTGEQCDDGGVIDGDGCSSSCVFEGACCVKGAIACRVLTRQQCNVTSGLYRGDQVPCAGDPDLDGHYQCDDNCPLQPNPGQFDFDGDGIGDVCDPDVDGDGVSDTRDMCTFTPIGSVVNSRGTLRADADEDCDVDMNDARILQVDFAGPGARCGNGTIEGAEQCDDGGESDACDADCTITFCGDRTVNSQAGEECDDGNRFDRDGCDSRCMIERPANDSCLSPKPITTGSFDFVTTLASTDGGSSIACDLFGSPQIEADLWYCYTSACTQDETVVVSFCGSQYDTKAAVYVGCDDCPTGEPIQCSDDNCGSGTSDSRLAFRATRGEEYLIRIGGFPGGEQQGRGTLTVRCGDDPCGADVSGDCFVGRPSEPACDNASAPETKDCCGSVCATDMFCCDVEWDDVCAAAAAGVCRTAGFETCTSAVGDCSEGHGSPGCADGGSGCCNTVCGIDPLCCIESWDSVCAWRATGVCALSCGPGAGSCTVSSGNGTEGCELQACCDAICPSDPFCCNTEWDDSCAAQATSAAYQGVCR